MLFSLNLATNLNGGLIIMTQTSNAHEKFNKAMKCIVVFTGCFTSAAGKHRPCIYSALSAVSDKAD